MYDNVDLYLHFEVVCLFLTARCKITLCGKYRNEKLLYACSKTSI